MAERHLTVRRQVGAPCASVWAVCADFPKLADHWDGLKASRPIGDQTHGVGARRRVDLKPVGTLVETVTAWEEGRMLATKNQPSALVPFKQAEARLTLEPNGDGTTITFDYRYVPRGGPIGRLTAPVIDRMLRGSFASMLAAIDEAALNDAYDPGDDWEPDTEFEAAEARSVPGWHARIGTANRLYPPGTRVRAPDGDEGVVLAIDAHGDVHIQLEHAGIGIFGIEELERFSRIT